MDLIVYLISYYLNYFKLFNFKILKFTIILNYIICWPALWWFIARGNLLGESARDLFFILIEQHL